MNLRRHVGPFCLASALIVSGPVRESFEVTHLPREVALVLLAAAAAFQLKATRLSPDRLDRAAAFFGLITMVSALVADSPAWSLRPALETVAALVLAARLREVTERRLFLGWLACAVGLLALLGAVEAFGLAHWSLPGRAPSSLLGQRNTLGHLIALAVPVFLGLGASAKRKDERIGWWAVLAMCAAVLVTTRSRAAWLGALISVPVMVAASRERLRIAGASSALAVGAVVALAMPVALGWRQTSPYLDSARRLVDAAHGSGAGRLVQWEHSLSLWPMRPFLGSGPGNWVVTWPLTHQGEPAGRFVNSDLVALLCERGLLGCVAFAAVVGLLTLTWKKRASHPFECAVATGVVISALVTGAFDAVLQLPASLLLFTTALTAGLSRQRPPGEPSRAWHLSWSLLGAVLLACSVGLSSAFVSRLLSTAQWAPVERLERAVQLDPTDTRTRLELAEAYISAGDCRRAEPHLNVALKQWPYHQAPKTLAAVCDHRLGGDLP